MIEIIKLLQSDNWYGVSERVDIAKGKREYCRTFKQVAKLYIRTLWLKL